MVDHIKLLGLVHRCILCCQVGHRASECHNIRKSTSLSPCKLAFDTYALGCTVFDATWYGTTVKETEEDHNPNDIADCVVFSIKSLEGFFPSLMEEPRRPFLDSRSVQPMVNQWWINTRIPRLRRQMLGVRSLAVKLMWHARKSGHCTLRSRKELR